MLFIINTKYLYSPPPFTHALVNSSPKVTIFCFLWGWHYPSFCNAISVCQPMDHWLLLRQSYQHFQGDAHTPNYIQRRPRSSDLICSKIRAPKKLLPLERPHLSRGSSSADSTGSLWASCKAQWEVHNRTPFLGLS